MAEKDGPFWRLLGPDADGTTEKYRDVEGADDWGYTGPLPIYKRYPLRELESWDEIGKVIAEEAQPDQLVVIKWYEEDCEHCKIMKNVFRKLSKDALNEDVIFLQLERKKIR